MQPRAKSTIIPTTPVVFSDGTDVYSRLAETYARHANGLFILAPSGTGKTYYVEHQEKTPRDWIDGDLLWAVTNADPTGDDWDSDSELVQEVNNRCDVVTHQARKMGFWILGSSNNFLRPDAIVLPPWEEHVAMIRQREQTAYDGGATEENLEGVRAHCEWIKHWEAEGVPRFDSIAAAVAHLESLANRPS